MNSTCSDIQSDGETIGKAAYITHLHARHVLCAMRMPSNFIIIYLYTYLSINMIQPTQW